MKPKNIIGKRIRLLRELRRWTQHKFARELRQAGYDISRDMVARWELCNSSVTDSHVLGVASVLRVSVVDLFPYQRQRRGRPPKSRPANFLDVPT